MQMQRMWIKFYGICISWVHQATAQKVDGNDGCTCNMIPKTNKHFLCHSHHVCIILLHVAL